MTPRRRLAPLAFLFAAGLAVGAFAAKKLTVSPAAFSGKEAKAAGEELLAAAGSLAESGSYENLAVARLYFQLGRKAEGQQIIDRVMAGKTKAGDVVRVARIYREAGDWARAKPLYDSVVAMAPNDEDWLAEVGAEHLLAGERARAEELFAASLQLDPSNLHNTLRMAGAYLGVRTD